MSAFSIARDWLDGFQDCVRARDYAAARGLFDPGVTAYGSLAGNMEGLEDLETRQWRRVWPGIRDFTFRVDQLRVEGSAPSGTLTLIVPWTSRGLEPAPHDRPGRATLVLRAALDGAWRCVHSHYSLLPGPSARP